MKAYCTTDFYKEKGIYKYKWYEYNMDKYERLIINGEECSNCSFIYKSVNRYNLIMNLFLKGRVGIWCDSFDKAMNFLNFLNEKYNFIWLDEFHYNKYDELSKVKKYKGMHSFYYMTTEINGCPRLQVSTFEEFKDSVNIFGFQFRNYTTSPAEKIYEWRMKDEKGRDLHVNNLGNILLDEIKNMNRKQVVEALIECLTPGEVNKIIKYLTK